MKLLQINVTANWGSTGRIAEDIGKMAIKNGWESFIAYGRGKPTSSSNLIRIGNDWDMRFHALQSRFFDNQGLLSKRETKLFIKKLELLNPDIIHLHNIHGYYINYPLLFDWLKNWGGPVVWTLHDCWPFTGHCAYYSYANCNKWQTSEGCCNCPQLNRYPTSLWKDNSPNNFSKKKEAFSNLPNLTLVTVSDWLKHELSKSFLNSYPSLTIHNGIDTSVFKPSRVVTYDKNKKIILGVANIWDKRKGLDDFISLRHLLPDNYIIILVGLSNDQIASLPNGITGIRKTENIKQLVDLYSMADVYVNTSVEETLGMTTIEAMACGTPVIVYDATACPEPVGENTGLIIPKSEIDVLAKSINRILSKDKTLYQTSLHDWVCKEFDKEINYNKYLTLYNHLLHNGSINSIPSAILEK